ncbi:MAG: holo-ACP synthase [Gammaproteobacteria bacterium]|nr:holo-ACP synthase [Gammaproteobacteria bacterium]
MIYGIGTDVVELERMERTWARWGTRARDRILCPGEIERFARARDPARFLAMHFAAKEATVKALGTGFCPRMTLHDAAVVPDPLGRPEIEFSEKGADFVAERGGGETYISLTDDAGIAFAVCVMLKAGVRGDR